MANRFLAKISGPIIISGKMNKIPDVVLPSALYLLAFMLFAGCTSLSPIAITLTDLGTASKSEHSMSGLKVMRSVNITGLGPHEVVGSISLDPDPAFFSWIDTNYFETKDFPDSLSLRLSPGCSHIIETTFTDEILPGFPNLNADNFPGATTEKVVAVRDGIRELVELVSNKTSLEIKHVILLNTAGALKDAVEDQNKILGSLQEQYPDDNFSTKSDVDQGIENIKVQLEALQQNIKNKREVLTSALNTPGIVVTRWTIEEKKKGALDALKAVTADASRSRQQEGFLVLGNPRITSLVLGDDFITQIRKDHLDAEACQNCKVKTFFKAKRTYVTYYQLSAQHIAWGEVRSGVSNKIIKADISKIVNTLHPYLKGVKGVNFQSLINDMQIKAELDISRAYDYGNSGLISGGKTKKFPFLYANMDELDSEQKRAQGYQPVYSARGTLEEVLSKTKNVKLDRNWPGSGSDCGDHAGMPQTE